MKFQKAIILLQFLAVVNARLGRRRVGGREYGGTEDIELVIALEDDDGDAFTEMTEIFTTLGSDVEVHSMLTRLKMATLRAKPRAVTALLDNNRIKAVDADLTFQQHSIVETPPKSVSMALGNKAIPDFLKSVGGCSNKDTVKVAVIDGGMEVSHSDFSFCRNGFCQGKRFMNPSEQGWDVSRNGHGNHVAGIIAASGLNGKLATGIVPDEKICLAIGRVFNDEGTGATLSAVVSSLDWAIEQGAHIVNMSFGISVDLESLHEAIIRLRQAGILAVASAGNAGTDKPNYPAYYLETLAVAAVDDSKKWASFSTYNDRVNLAAPGVGIVSTFPGNTIGAMDGTSMSVPFVSGAAALMKRDCMHCSDQDIWSCLIQTVEPLDCPVEKCGAGFLQAGAAYQCLKESACCTTDESGMGPEITTTATNPTQPRSDPAQCQGFREFCATNSDCCSGRCNRRRGRCKRQK